MAHRFRFCVRCGTRLVSRDDHGRLRPTCPACLSREVAWERASGRGTVWTWTIVRGPTLPAFESRLPYNVVDVLLDEGVHFVSEVLDCPPDAIYPAMPVEAVFVRASTDVTLVKFRRRTS